MLNRRRVAGVLALALALGAGLPAASPPASAATPNGARQAADDAAFGGRLIVTWKGIAPGTLRIAGVRAIEATNRPMRSVVVAGTGLAAAVAARLRADPRVLSVVPDARLTPADWPADAPDDPFFVDQGSLAQVGVTDAWTTTTGDPSVVVAVIDTGFDLAHPDLDGVAVVNPRNEVWNNTDLTDDIGHGTYVAGMIVAETDNALGIAGIAPASTLMPIKVADEEGGMSLADLLDGVDWAREHGADIINMSLGGILTPEQRDLSQPTFSTARQAGILMIAASGNDGERIRSYPASFFGVVSVGAVDGTDTLAAFSNTGKALDLTAPGVDLWSLAPDADFEIASGTSASSPHVAGVAALVRAARPGLAVDELEAVLRASAVDLGAPGWDPLYGDGRVDAAAALVEPVPAPIPNLEPPLPAPSLEIVFTDPAGPVTQTGSTHTARITASSEVAFGFAALLSWPINVGACDLNPDPGVTEIPFALEMPLTGLRQGRCYAVTVLAVDEDGNFAEALSDLVKVVDPIVPTIVRRRPAPGATGVDRATNIRIRFSERVSGTVRVRNLATGLAIKVASRWDASTNTLILDPARLLFPRTRYRVEVTGNVQDRAGNPVGARSWLFKTGR